MIEAFLALFDASQELPDRLGVEDWLLREGSDFKKDIQATGGREGVGGRGSKGG
jgi:hypothetical protein